MYKRQTLGSVKLKKGVFQVPVMTRADQARIAINNSTYLPANITSAEYEANFYIRSRRA